MASKPKNINDYLARLSDEQRLALEKIRRAVRAAAPTAKECISYDIPGFRLRGKLLISFGAATNHCAFYPGAHPIRVHKNDLTGYEIGRGTIRFPAKRPLPAHLVRKLVKSRITEHAA